MATHSPVTTPTQLSGAPPNTPAERFAECVLVFVVVITHDNITDIACITCTIPTPLLIVVNTMSTDYVLHYITVMTRRSRSNDTHATLSDKMTDITAHTRGTNTSNNY